MHYEIDFGNWDTPDKLRGNSVLYIQRGKDGYGKREILEEPESNMFRAELELFAGSCRSASGNELSASNGNAAVACVYAALRSIERNGELVKLDEVREEARRKLAGGKRDVA
jgi:hypothetical protein